MRRVGPPRNPARLDGATRPPRYEWLAAGPARRQRRMHRQHGAVARRQPADRVTRMARMPSRRRRPLDRRLDRRSHQRTRHLPSRLTTRWAPAGSLGGGEHEPALGVSVVTGQSSCAGDQGTLPGFRVTIIACGVPSLCVQARPRPRHDPARARTRPHHHRTRTSR